MNSKIKTSWDVSEYYSGLKDEKFLADWNTFRAWIENFIKQYESVFHTFRKSDDFLYFYQEYERLISISECIQYFLFYIAILAKESNNDCELLWEIGMYEQKFQHILYDFSQKTEKMMTHCDENFLENFEKILENPEFQHWKFFMKYWLKSEKQRRQKWQGKSGEIQVIEAHIAQKISDYEAICQTNSENMPEMIAILYDLTRSRHQLAKNFGYENFFEYQMQKYMISSDFAHFFIKNITKIAEYTPQKLPNLSHQHFSFSEMKDLIFPIAIRIFGYKDFFKTLFEPSHIHLAHWNGASFTTGIQSKKPYIYLNIEMNWWGILTLSHEMGHAFQLFLSQKNSCLQFSASPFLWEFCAFFFQKVIAKHLCFQKNKNTFSLYNAILNQKHLSRAYEIFSLEWQIFHKSQKPDFSIQDIENTLYNHHFQHIDRQYFLNYYQIFSSPFYTLTYIFALIFAENMSYDDENFEKIAASGASDSVDAIFESFFSRMHDDAMYAETLNAIYSYQ